MKTLEIKETIQMYLDLVEKSTGTAEENEWTLRFLLDKLAMASHFAKPDYIETELEAPHREYDELRKQIFPRFPNYGLYRSADTDPCPDKSLVGDAINDITDIALELSEVLWLWDNASESDAMWQFHSMYNCHWSSHLRELQLYAHQIEKEKDSTVL